MIVGDELLGDRRYPEYIVQPDLLNSCFDIRICQATPERFAQVREPVSFSNQLPMWP